MMTEDKAKTKWCPQAFNNSCNRNPTTSAAGMIPVGALCIASDCMMWVVDMQLDVKASPRGHCGLVK